MRKSFPLVFLTAVTLFSTSSVIAKRFIYDDQTRTYTEIRDDYNNGGYYGQPPSPSNQPQQYDNNRYYYGDPNAQRFDKALPRPSWDWKVGDKIPSQFRSSQFKVKSSESSKLYDVYAWQQWYKINNDYVLANDNYEIVKILK